MLPPPPTDPYVTNSVIRFVSNGPDGAINLAVDETTRRHGFCCPSKCILLRSDSCALAASFVKTVSGLKVPPVFPWQQRHARHCLPAASRLLSWVPWASVPHVFVPRLPSTPRYCALLRLPSSIPVGPLSAPFRYLGVTRSLCPAWLMPGSVRRLAASARIRQGVGCAGHPCSGDLPQGDGRLSRVPGLPICPHAPLSDPGGVLLACLGASRFAAFPGMHTVGFESGCPDSFLHHHYTFFGVQ